MEIWVAFPQSESLNELDMLPFSLFTVPQWTTQANIMPRKKICLFPVTVLTVLLDMFISIIDVDDTY